MMSMSSCSSWPSHTAENLVLRLNKKWWNMYATIDQTEVVHLRLFQWPGALPCCFSCVGEGWGPPTTGAGRWPCAGNWVADWWCARASLAALQRQGHAECRRGRQQRTGAAGERGGMEEAVWSRGEGRGSGVRDGKGQTNSVIEIWVCGRVSESWERVTVVRSPRWLSLGGGVSEPWSDGGKFVWVEVTSKGWQMYSLNLLFYRLDQSNRAISLTLA